jgi:hypothetical protein
MSKVEERESRDAARRQEMQERDDDASYLYHYVKSVELIKHNHKCGMSRATMEKIWPYRLLNLVIGHQMGRTH